MLRLMLSLCVAFGHANLNLIIFLVIVIVTLIIPVDLPALLSCSVGLLVACDGTANKLSQQYSTLLSLQEK